MTEKTRMTEEIDEIWMDLGAGEIFTQGDFVGADDDTEGLVRYVREDLYGSMRERAEKAEASEADAVAEYHSIRRELSDMRQRAEKVEAKAKRLRRAATRAGACLVAAISLLREGGRLATPSDKMFNQMLEDYQNAVEGLRATLRQDEGDDE